MEGVIIRRVDKDLSSSYKKHGWQLHVFLITRFPASEIDEMVDLIVSAFRDGMPLPDIVYEDTLKNNI